MARHDQRHRVVGKRGSDRADRLRLADLGRDPAVGPDLATRDLESLHPDHHLEWGVATEVEGDVRAAIAGEPASDRAREPRGNRVARRDVAPDVRPEARLECRAIRGLADPRDAAAIPGHEGRAEWRVD